MSTSSSVVSVNPSPASPPAFVAAFPTNLSHRPLLGILGVILGAGSVTLTARLLSLGLADLKGNVGIGFDDGAWIATVYNTALIFIGPISVYLGGLLGARRVLLIGAGTFSVTCACLPLVHSFGLMVFFLVLAGLTSGTFYPLTLTFALRNIPLRYLTVVLGLYVLSIEGAVNFAPSLYGFFRDYLSWKWMFWCPAAITPLMMTCIDLGIPPPPRREGQQPPPSFAGFLYLSTGLALVYAALDQGERLDWWRSGEFTAIFAAGAFLLLCALERRLRKANHLVDLSHLQKWNTILLAVALFAFRFVLLATIMIIPQSLAIRGLDPLQYGPAVLWSAACEMVLAFIGALFLHKGMDTRLLMAVGFACIAFACLLNADFTSAWSPENYFRTELLLAVGQSFAMLGLVSSIILQAAFSGTLEAPHRTLTVSAFFHTVRLFGGQAGAVCMVHYVAVREKLHSNLLGLHVQSGQWVTMEMLRKLAMGMAPKSSGPLTAAGRALVLIDARTRLQASSLTFIDAFQLIAWACAIMLVITVMLRKAPMGFHQLAAAQQETISAKEGRK